MKQEPNISQVKEQLVSILFLLMFVVLLSCRGRSGKSNETSKHQELSLSNENKISFPKEIVSLISWNIQDFGNQELQSRIETIIEIVKAFDIIAIQEVNAKTGAPDVARLVDGLNRSGHQWDYRISDPTDSPGMKSERYAYIWKTKRLKIKSRAWLDKEVSNIIYREPFLARFQFKGKDFLLVNYHSRKYTDRPEAEIACFYKYQQRFPDDRILIAGDFNAELTNPVFKPLFNSGFESNLEGNKTTLKKKCKNKGEYLYKAIDFILYEEEEIGIEGSGVYDFVGECAGLELARKVSDHLPVYVGVRVGE